MKPAKCPFYPDSCTVEFHPNMQHVWKNDLTTKRVSQLKAIAKDLAKTKFDPDDEGTLGLPDYRERVIAPPVEAITNALKAGPRVTNKASERAQAWNKANRKQYNARQKVLMAGKRAGRGKA